MYHIILDNIISNHLISFHVISCHIVSPYIISREHILFSNKKTSSSTRRRHLLLPEEDIFFSHKKTEHVSRPYIQAPNTSSRVHTHPIGSGPQKIKFSTFSQIHPMTFGMLNTIITDSFQQVFEFSKNIFFRNLFFIIFLTYFCSNDPNILNFPFKYP